VGWIVFALIVFVVVWPLVLAVGMIVQRVGRGDQSPAEGAGTFIMFAGSAAVALIWVIGTLVAILNQVPNGHVGAVYTFKAVTGTTGAGLVVTAPWQSVQSMDVREQSYGWVASDHRKDADFTGVKFVGGRMETFSVNNQDVFMDVTINIKVDRGAVEAILDNVGPDYFGKLFVTELPNIVKEETVKYDSTVIAQHREDIRRAVSRRMQSILDEKGYKIAVTKIGIFNMSFDPEYTKAIRDKEIAKQHSEEQRNLVEAEKAKADQKIATAHGEAERLIEEARGQAGANELVAGSLTEQLIRFQALQRLADNIQIALIPSGQGIIIDPSTLLGPLQQEAP